MKTEKGISKQNGLYAMIYSLLFSTAMIFGAQLEKQGYIEYVSAGTLGGICVCLLFSFPTVCGIFYLMRSYERKSGAESALRPRDESRGAHKGGWKDKTDGRVGKKEFWLVAIVLLLCWLPYFLSSYPGYFLYDAQEELNMVLTADYTTHHPLAHVLLLGWVIKVVHKVTGSYNAGIAVYVICQAVFAALCFSYILCRMRRWGIRRWICVLGAIYLCAFPVVPMYVLCTAKDLLFTLFVLLFLVNMIDLASDSRESCVPLIINGTAMLLLRNNGIYALVFAIPLILAVMRGIRKKMALSLLAVLAAYFLCSFGLKVITNADNQERQEILTVPIQQLARVYHDDEGALDEDQKETLYRYLSDEALHRYRPTLSDPVKMFFDSAAYSEGSGDFWKLWLQVGKENPASYLNAFLVNNYGFWYPYASLNCYKGNQVYTFIYEDSSYFGYETEAPGERVSLFPALDRFVRKLSLEISWQRIPGIRVLFHPACYFWVFFLGICYHMSMRRYRVTVCAAPVFLLFLTVLLGPAVLVRYVLYFYLGFPLLLAFLLEGRRGKDLGGYEIDQ